MNYEHINTMSIFDKPYKGKVIKDWVWYHTHNNTKYRNAAKGLGKVFNLDDAKTYIIHLEIGELNIKEVNV